MKTYKQRTDDIINKAQKEKAVQKKRTRIASFTALGAAVLAGFVGINCALFIPYDVEPPSVEQYKDSEYYSVIKQLNTISYDPPVYKNNYQTISANIAQFLDNFSFGCAAADKNATGGMDYAPESFGEAMSAYVETTDNQVSGVIEADLIKRTNSHIFYLRQKSGATPSYYYSYEIIVYTVQGEDSEEVGSFLITSKQDLIFHTMPEMYLSADGTRLTVIAECYAEKEINREYTVLINLDVSDVTNIKELSRTYLSGEYSSSRFVDGKLLVINNFQADIHMDFSDPVTFLPRYGAWNELEFVSAEDIVCHETAETAEYAVVCEIDQSSLEIGDCKALLSYSDEVYVSEENIFVTMPYTAKREVDKKHTELLDMTEISCLSYAGEGFEYKGSFFVEGSVKNQYSMDEYEGMLRVATTYERRDRSLENSYAQTSTVETNANLYCVRLSDFTVAGKVEKFAPDGESVESVRFDGTKAYVCTAEVITFTDPVYAFDLSNPNYITSVDTGVIEGYSSSLVNFGNGYLLGIGYGEHNGMLKIEIYKETATKVEGVCAFEAEATFSEDYKSYFIDRRNKLVGLGMTCYYYDGMRDVVSEYILLHFDGDELIPLIRTELNGADAYKRAVLADGYFYMLGDEFKVEKIF